MKRDIGEVLSQIWKGFYFKIETPSLEWRKMIGSEFIGASMGIDIKNFLEVDLSKFYFNLVLI